MELLKKENATVWVLLYIITFGLSNILLAFQLKLIEKDAWYKKTFYIIPLMLLSFGTALISPYFPFLILGFIFNYQITILISKKLSLPGKEYYTNPYFLIILGLVPLIGWSILLSLYIFLNIYIIISLYNGKCEKYINN